MSRGIGIEKGLEGRFPRPVSLDPASRMNKTERRYADDLYKLQLAGEILGYEYEPIKLRLAKSTFYTPDFLVVYPDHFEFHEVKGYARDEAMVKVKVAGKAVPVVQVSACKTQWEMWVDKDKHSLVIEEKGTREKCQDI